MSNGHPAHARAYPEILPIRSLCEQVDVDSEPKGHLMTAWQEIGRAEGNGRVHRRLVKPFHSRSVR